MGGDVDPITVECIVEGLRAIVREMRAAVKSTAYSSVIYEMDDFSCGLFDPATQMVAQSEDHPGHVMPLPWSVQSALEEFHSELYPGDIILLNDPYRGGTHLNDITFVYPVFLSGELFIFPAVREHWTDVGGMTPGSYSGLSTEIYQEGIRIPPIKICERGVFNNAALALLFANMRIPHEREGDFWAAIAALRTAERRILELVQRYGEAEILRAIAINLDRSEQRIREKIAHLPDGEYYYEDYLEFYHNGALDPVLMRLKLTVAGDQLIADFSGSSPQVAGVVNSSLAVTAAGVFVAVKATLDPDGPINSGIFRALTVKAPVGTIANVQPYAPAGAHGEVRKRAVSVTMGALAQIIPERVSGDLCGASFPNSIGGVDRRYGCNYVFYEAPAGGNGGFFENDGPSAMGNIDFGDIKTILPTEAIENEFPLVVESVRLRTDSAGDGRRRGGLGVRREVRLLAEHASYSVLGDRAILPPFGVHGAFAAAQASTSLIRGGKQRGFATPGKVTGFPLLQDDVVVIESAGGGGFGDPLQREVERVAEDVREGYISPERARERYGVVVVRRDLTVDVEATRRLRTRKRSNDRQMKTVHSAEDPYRWHLGRHRVVRLDAATLRALRVREGDIVEVWGRHPAPLRAWVERTSDGNAPAHGLREALLLPLDTIGHRILGIAPGDVVTVRKLRIPMHRSAQRSQ